MTIFSVLLLCWVIPCAAAEIDSVTPRDLALEDSLERLNAIFNDRIAQGVARANSKRADYEDMAADEFCDEELLYAELRKAIFQSLTASWGLKGYALDKQLRELMAEHSFALALEDSIYRDISYLEGFSLNLKELSDVVRIDGHLVGLDKLGHFFAEGWQYFERSQFSQAGLGQAMAWGRAQEEGKFGFATTGIFSHADLTANLNGWRFWNKVLLADKDPLKGFVANLFARPYVSCDIQLLSSVKHRKIIRAWAAKGHFDLADYVDGAWDEGNNCNSFKDGDIAEKVETRISEVNADFHCPVQPQQCQAAGKRYGEYGGELLHPLCLQAGRY